MKTRQMNKRGLTIMMAIPLIFVIAMVSGCGLVGGGYGYGPGYNRGYMPYRNNTAYNYTPPPMPIPVVAPGTMIQTVNNGRDFYGGPAYGNTRYAPDMAPDIANNHNVREVAKASVNQQLVVTMIPAKQAQAGNCDACKAVEVLANELDSQNKRVDRVEHKLGIAPATPPKK